MEEIILREVRKAGNTISYHFDVSGGLACYFSGKPFVIEYCEDIESVPDAVATVPFVCNVLPIIWLTDSILHVKELDKAFYDCIPNVRKGYETMYPESTFAGRIEVKNIVECDIHANGSSAAFFSGGLDSVDTLVSHFEERPALISIWGSDIRFENAKGWEIVHRGIEEYAERYELADVVIRSSFRDFDNEGALHKRFSTQLKDGWWHGVKHGIGLLGHVAPYAYLHGLSTVYIASTYCRMNGLVRCASSPLTDNHVKFASTRVVHDGFESSRQDKVRNVVEYVSETGNTISLHVCWESQSGSNCCHCEKCYRTMVGLIAEGAEPLDYGFPDTIQTIGDLRQKLIGRGALTKFLSINEWVHIQKRLCENVKAVKKMQYWKDVRWMMKADFAHPETLKAPFNLREWLSKFKYYQALHKIKEKLHE